jgi:hypothetical protein
MPRGRPAHRKAAGGNAVVVDPVAFLCRFEGFEDVDLARQLESIAVAAVGMQDDCVLGRYRADAIGPIADEVEFTEGLAAAVEPQVTAEAPGPLLV